MRMIINAALLGLAAFMAAESYRKFSVERPYPLAEELGEKVCGMVQWKGELLTPNNERFRFKYPEQYKAGEEVCISPSK